MQRRRDRDIHGGAVGDSASCRRGHDSHRHLQRLGEPNDPYGRPGVDLHDDRVDGYNVRYPQQLALSASGQPPSVTVTFNPASILSGAKSMQSFSGQPSAPTGTYPITITASNGSVTHTTTLTLTVTGSGPPPVVTPGLGGCLGAHHRL